MTRDERLLALAAEWESLAGVPPCDTPLAKLLRQHARELREALAAPPVQRDESVPPPGWEPYGPAGAYRPDFCRPIAAAWRIYDAEHGYAPPAPPREPPALPDGYDYDGDEVWTPKTLKPAHADKAAYVDGGKLHIYNRDNGGACSIDVDAVRALLAASKAQR